MRCTSNGIIGDRLIEESGARFPERPSWLHCAHQRASSLSSAKGTATAMTVGAKMVTQIGNTTFECLSGSDWQ